MSTDATENVKGVIYTHASPLLLVTNSGTSEGVAPATKNWVDLTFSISPSFSNIDYVLFIVGTELTNEVQLYYDAGNTNQGHWYDRPYEYDYLSSIDSGDVYHDDNKYSIYATYTPSGGGTAVKDTIQEGIVAFPR